MHFNSQQDNTHFQVEWHPHVKCTYTKSQPEEKYTQVKPPSSKSNLTSSSKKPQVKSHPQVKVSQIKSHPYVKAAQTNQTMK